MGPSWSISRRTRPLIYYRTVPPIGLAAWLQLQPGAEVVSRDRGGIYADGATRGAPQAVQVADRCHLLCNLTSAVERVLEQKRSALRKQLCP
jgi:transposase